MKSCLSTVISGGQTGVDQAALRAALDAGLCIGGWCPPGRTCESGLIPREFFSLVETCEEKSPRAPYVVPRSLRTEWNIRDSDATIVLNVEPGTPTAHNDLGTKWTVDCAKTYYSARPVKVVYISLLGSKQLKKKTMKQDMRDIIDWLTEEVPWVQTLNVAGPSEGSCPGIYTYAYELLSNVLGEMKRYQIFHSSKMSLQSAKE